jgi:transposase-like protein
MAAQKKYPDELRERAVRMVLEIRERDGRGWFSWWLRREIARRQGGPVTGAGRPG